MPSANKTPSQVLLKIREHILSFPRVESHYCRKSRGKEYLPANLSLPKMYALYKLREGENAASEKIYRKEFIQYAKVC